MMAIYGAVMFLLIFATVALSITGLLLLLEFVRAGRLAPLPTLSQPSQFDWLDEDSRQAGDKAEKDESRPLSDRRRRHGF